MSGKCIAGPWTVRVDDNRGEVTVWADAPPVCDFEDNRVCLFEMTWDECVEGDRERWVATARILALAPFFSLAMDQISDLLQTGLPHQALEVVQDARAAAGGAS